MKSIILPVAEPYISSYAVHSDLLSVLAVDKRTEAWVISNYMQVEMDRPEFILGPRAKYDFYHDRRGHGTPCPHVIKNVVSPAVVTSTAEIVDFICKCLFNEYYVTVYVDLFYVPKSKVYKQSHFTHTIFIYGCDFDNRLIHFSGYLKPTGAYQSSVMSFDELRRAYDSTIQGDSKEYRDISGGYNLVLYRRQFDNTNGDPNLHFINLHMNDYLSSTNNRLTNGFLIDEAARREHVFGIDCYDSIHTLVEGNQGGSANFSVRSFHCLLQHKLLLKRRINFVLDYLCIDHQQARISAEELLKLARNIFYIYLESTVNKSFSKYDELKFNLMHLRRQEKDTVGLFLSLLPS